jgi:hypothetical protein
LFCWGWRVMYPFKRMKTKGLRVKTRSKGLRGTFWWLKAKGLRAAFAVCSLSLILSDLRIAGWVY